jgi:hypothetical protein
MSFWMGFCLMFASVFKVEIFGHVLLDGFLIGFYLQINVS